MFRSYDHLQAEIYLLGFYSTEMLFHYVNFRWFFFCREWSGTESTVTEAPTGYCSDDVEQSVDTEVNESK
jgi:hypothetical protein